MTITLPVQADLVVIERDGLYNMHGLTSKGFKFVQSFVVPTENLTREQLQPFLETARLFRISVRVE